MLLGMGKNRGRNSITSKSDKPAAPKDERVKPKSSSPNGEKRTSPPRDENQPTPVKTVREDTPSELAQGIDESAKKQKLPALKKKPGVVPLPRSTDSRSATPSRAPSAVTRPEVGKASTDVNLNDPREYDNLFGRKTVG
jgi:hypothetical protein